MADSPPGVVVFRRTGGPHDVDAIDEYSRRLTAALREAGTGARYEHRGLAPILAEPERPPWVLLQYNPFRYGRSGFAPRLLFGAWRLRRRGVPLAIMVHEAWVEMRGPKSIAIGMWQRLQLGVLLRLADRVMTSTEALAARIRGASHLPIAANIMPSSSSSSAAKARLGLQGRLVLTLFGGRHPSRAIDHAEVAIEAVAQVRGSERIAILNLGADAPALRVRAGTEVHTPGTLAPEELSLCLAASDLVLLPFKDGVSTRRSTLMASLAHGLPVLGLLGPSTDSVLAAATRALVLTPVGDRDHYARVAVELSDDLRRLTAIGAAGRELYTSRFDWPVLAARMAGVLAESCAAGPERSLPAGVECASHS